MSSPPILWLGPFLCCCAGRRRRLYGSYADSDHGLEDVCFVSPGYGRDHNGHPTEKMAKDMAAQGLPDAHMNTPREKLGAVKAAGVGNWLRVVFLARRGGAHQGLAPPAGHSPVG